MLSPLKLQQSGLCLVHVFITCLLNAQTTGTSTLTKVTIQLSSLLTLRRPLIQYIIIFYLIDKILRYLVPGTRLVPVNMNGFSFDNKDIDVSVPQEPFLGPFPFYFT